jgi:hypothetical protein
VFISCVLSNVYFYLSIFRLYHAVDRSICGWWCDSQTSRIMRWINLFGFMLDGFEVPRHAVD